MKPALFLILLLIPLSLLTGFVPEAEFPEEALSRESLKKEIAKYDFKYPDLIYRQAIIESGLTSSLAVNHNNLMGMFHPKKRHTTSKGKSKNGYATYETWQDCVEDRYIYDTLYLKHHSRDSYLDYLERVYCGFPGYRHALLKVKY